MKNIFILLALFSFSFSKAQGTIQINNLTPYTLKFQLIAELDNSCSYFLYGWNSSYPSSYEYMFDLPAPVLPATVSSVTYTSYANTASQTPNMTHFKKSDTGTLYLTSVANTIYGTGGLIPSHWAFLKFNLMDDDESVFDCTIGVLSDCNYYSSSCEDEDFFAEIFTLEDDGEIYTYFFVFPQ